MTTSKPASATGDDQDTAQRAGKLERNYWRLWWANGVNSVGNGAFAAALPLLAATLTHDPRQISLIAAVTFLPWLLLSLPAGVLIDRYDRVALM
ncbi:MFS transporter [Nocardia sp. NPDC051052]|uniref:MFS transporter n=1 Tax=Nocardia sp. NPDC051052 TaxID=3364322 RepID=UPI003790AE3D